MSFTIKCDKCGNEARLFEAIHEVHHYKYWKSDSSTLDFNYNSDEYCIECRLCKNSISQDH
jgi:NAD-dependent dihydropyrimidine dehydrogenase PreA subunit